MNSWADIGFEIENTADSSLTLRLLQPNYPDATHGESMHHSGGAATETLLIYGAPIREILQETPKARFLIVGLGLGYIEMTIAREALLLGKNTADVGRITSFESVPELRDCFLSWVNGGVGEKGFGVASAAAESAGSSTELSGDMLGKLSGKLSTSSIGLVGQQAPLPAEIFDTYQAVAESIVRDTDLTVDDIRKFLSKTIHPEDLLGALNEDFAPIVSYHGIMYDLFSSKTTPHLWEENFLVSFLRKAADKKFCFFSTYACRVSLKAALAAEGFELLIRPGFKSKRNSTLGSRVVE